MKVLVLMSDKARHFPNALYASLRVRVGTCDAYHLTTEQLEGVESFFRAFIRLEHYDRIVVAMPPSYVLRKIKFFRTLPSLVILRLEHDSATENAHMAKLFAQMPWLRWIGIDDEVCDEFAHQDRDAYWIPPSYDAEWFHHNRPPREVPMVHVFDPAHRLGPVLQGVIQSGLQYVPVDGSDHYLSEHMKPQDIFIFHPKRAHYEPGMVIQAMASGAVVILPTPNLKRRVLYGWHDYHDCLFYDDAAALPDLLGKVLVQPSLRASISRRAVDKVLLFHPKEVGQRLGGRLEITLRTPREYPAPRKLFGIELGW